MALCSDPCPACTKSCEVEASVEHTTHRHDYEFTAKNRSGHNGFVVRVSHEWEPKT